MSVSLYNSGSHIADERLDEVFKRYYQMADGNVSHRYGWGTGIGLYYVKRLVSLHHGSISVANVEGGVEFSFVLPMDDAAYRDVEHDGGEPSVMQLPVHADSHATTDVVAEVVAGKPRMLIVDDDIDVAQYIRSIFAADYDVINRYSAEAALADTRHCRYNNVDDVGRGIARLELETEYEHCESDAGNCSQCQGAIACSHP